MAKTPQLHPKQGIPVSYPNSHLSKYSGALVLQFAPGPFYIFLALSLMVLYDLESLLFDDYNLTYRKNKKRGVDKFLTAFPLKTQHFPFTNIPQNQSKPTPTKILFKTQPKTTPNSTTTNTNTYNPKVGAFINLNSRKWVRV